MSPKVVKEISCNHACSDLSDPQRKSHIGTIWFGTAGSDQSLIFGVGFETFGYMDVSEELHGRIYACLKGNPGNRRPLHTIHVVV
jgi:hypothetical protein